MKKTILAIAIPALFASAANATVVYEKDGTSFDIYGRVQANLYADHNDADTELVGTSRLGWSGKVALNNTWSAIAKAEWQVASENSDKDTKTVFGPNGNPIGTVESDNDGKFQARHVWVGFDGSQYGKIIFGQTDTAFYDVLEPTDIFNEWGDAGNFYDGRQEGQIIYSNSYQGFHGKVSYQTNDDSAVAVSDVGGSSVTNTFGGAIKRNYGYALAAGYDFDFGLGLNAGYAFSDLESNLISNANGDKSEWAVGAHYAINGFYFAGMYTEGDLDSNGNLGSEGSGYELAGSYNVDAWTFLAGYNYKEGRDKINNSDYKEAVDEFLLGAQYAFTPKLKAYTEYKLQNVGDLDDEFTVALQYSF